MAPNKESVGEKNIFKNVKIPKLPAAIERLFKKNNYTKIVQS